MFFAIRLMSIEQACSLFRMKASAVLLSFLLCAPALAQSDSPNNNADGKAPDATTGQSVVPPDSTKLVLVQMVKPVYPLEANKQKLQGQVVIHLTISPEGNVIAAEPVSGNPIFTESAVAAMKQWKYLPFYRGGHAVQTGYKATYNFAFEERVIDKPNSVATALPANSPPTASAANGTTAADGAVVPNTVQISAKVSQGLLVHQVVQVYPKVARQRNLQGTVVLQAVIGKDGHLKSLKPLSGPSDFYESAVGAVQQWRYKPYILNGEPVEVETTIRVNYQLGY